MLFHYREIYLLTPNLLKKKKKKKKKTATFSSRTIISMYTYIPMFYAKKDVFSKQDYRRKILHFEWKHVALASWIAYRLLTLDTIRNLDHSLTKLIELHRVCYSRYWWYKKNYGIHKHTHTQNGGGESREQPQVVLL